MNIVEPYAHLIDVPDLMAGIALLKKILKQKQKM